MWYLTEDNEEGGPKPHYWLGGVLPPPDGVPEGRSIGRKHSDIRLSASSVSRLHARLTVQKTPFFDHPHPHRRATSVSVVDLSAYGTFLKYPKNHAHARDTTLPHARLDKNHPLQLFDGAQLSFGSPIDWWRLVDLPLVVVPSALSQPQRTRVSDIALATGLEVGDAWSNSSTHLVTPLCSTRSMKLLSAIAARAAVVSPAWLESVHHVVTNACKSIATAPNRDAAATATAIPDTAGFCPMFRDDDVQKYTKAVTDGAFKAERIARREQLFRGIGFAFACEQRRAAWTPVLEACHGRAMPLSAAKEGDDGASADETGRAKPTRIICIRDSNASERGKRGVMRAAFDDCVLVTALLTADVAPFDNGAGEAGPVSQTPRESTETWAAAADDGGASGRKRLPASGVFATGGEDSGGCEDMSAASRRRDSPLRKRVSAKGRREADGESAPDEPAKRRRRTTRVGDGDKRLQDSMEASGSGDGNGDGNGDGGNGMGEGEARSSGAVDGERDVTAQAVWREDEDGWRVRVDSGAKRRVRDRGDDSGEGDGHGDDDATEQMEVLPLALPGGSASSEEMEIGSVEDSNGDVRLFRGTTISKAAQVSLQALPYDIE